MATATATPPSAQPKPQPQSLSAIRLQKGERGIALGTTGSGKSTLIDTLRRQWLAEHGDRARVLIVDSKPRYRAQWELTGVSTRFSRRYKGWAHGEFVLGSVVLPLVDPWSELKQAWAHDHQVAIAQAESLEPLKAAMQAFYDGTNRKYAQLLDIDEAADFFGTSASFGIGHPILRAFRSGRERGLAVLAASQRPRHIPSAVITEATNLYAFELAFDKDWQHLREMGLPRDLQAPTQPHAFVFYSKRSRQAGTYRLKLEH